jgi:hypothetical protein
MRPPISRKTRRGMIVALRIAAMAALECVSTKTCQASAGTYAPSPSAEIVWPPQSNANGRDCNARVNRTCFATVSILGPTLSLYRLCTPGTVLCQIGRSTSRMARE